MLQQAAVDRDAVMTVSSRPRLCQNVKSPIPVEIINRLLFKLHYKVGVIINSSPYFSKRMEKISPLMIFFVRFDTAWAVSRLSSVPQNQRQLELYKQAN